MDTDESVGQGAAGARVPASRPAEEQAFSFRERHGDPMMASPDQDLPFDASALCVAAHPVSVSLPASPSRFDVAQTEAEFPPRHAAAVVADASRMLSLSPPMVSVAFEHFEKVVFLWQPIPAAASELPNAQDSQSQSQVVHDDSMSRGSGARMGRSKARRDTSDDSFKTWSGKLEKQLTTHLRVVRQPQPQQQEGEPEEDDGAATSGRPYASMPRIQRFFAALEGPELDKLRSEEELVLPSDKTWPFLLRFPVSAFGMCLGMSSQAILWKNIAISVPAHHAPDKPRATVRLGRAHVLRVGAVRVQGHLLLRGRAAGVLPSDPRQLLLRAVDRLPLPGHRRAGACGGEPPALAVVRAHGPHRVPGAQDIRAVDIRRAEAAVEGGEPVEPPVHRRQLRRRAAGSHHGSKGGAHLLLRRWARALHRAVRDAVPEAAHERDAAEGPPPGVLPLRGRAQRRLPGLGADHRRVRVRLPHRLLHRHVPLRHAGCADQHVQGVQVLAGVVGVHVPDDERGHRVDTLLVGGEERVHAGHVHRAVRGGHAHGGGALPDHAAARDRAPRPLPQRHLHRHHGA